MPTAPASLTLADVLARGIQSSPSLAAAAARQRAARARLDAAAAARRFQIEWLPSGSESSADVYQPPPAHETFGTLVNDLRFPLPIGRRLSAAQEQAREEYNAATAAFQTARFDVIQSLGNAYLELLRSAALRAVAEETLRQAQRQLDETRIRNQAGDVPDLDVLRAQVPVSSAQASLIGARNREAAAQRSLNALLQLPGTAMAAPVEIPPPSPPPFSLPDAEARAAAHAPELLEAAANVRAAHAAVAVARRSREPTYELHATDTRSGDRTSFSRLDSLLVSATVPLNDGGLARAQVREQEASVAAAEAAQTTAQAASRVAVDAAYYNVQSALAQLDAQREAARVAGTALDLIREAYTAGRNSIRDVLDAQAALAQAQAAVTQATYDAQAALVALYRAMGEEMP